MIEHVLAKRHCLRVADHVLGASTLSLLQFERGEVGAGEVGDERGVAHGFQPWLQTCCAGTQGLAVNNVSCEFIGTPSKGGLRWPLGTTSLAQFEPATRWPSTEDHLGLVFNLDEARWQTVHLWRQALADGAEEWMQIESPIGRIGEGDAVAVLREVGNMVCGGVATLGDLLVLRHSVPLANVDLNGIEHPLRLVVVSADRLERRYTGRDEF